jgi:hypothetical protein
MKKGFIALLLFTALGSYAQNNEKNNDKDIKYAALPAGNTKEKEFTAEYEKGREPYNKAVEIISKLDVNASLQDVEKTQKSSKELFKTALPHLEKANSLKPMDKNTAQALYNIYISLGDNVKAENIKKSLYN